MTVSDDCRVALHSVCQMVTCGCSCHRRAPKKDTTRSWLLAVTDQQGRTFGCVGFMICKNHLAAWNRRKKQTPGRPATPNEVREWNHSVTSCQDCIVTEGPSIARVFTLAGLSEGLYAEEEMIELEVALLQSRLALAEVRKKQLAEQGD